MCVCTHAHTHSWAAHIDYSGQIEHIHKTSILFRRNFVFQILHTRDCEVLKGCIQMCVCIRASALAL